jgi:hypothetical protein
VASWTREKVSMEPHHQTIAGLQALMEQGEGQR